MRGSWPGPLLLLGLLAAAAPVAAREAPAPAPAPGDSAAVTAPADSAATAVPAAAPADGPRGDIVVTAVGVRAEQGGSLLFLLYRGEPGWLEPARAFAIQAAPGLADSVQARFAAVPCDSAWAVQVIHDKNGNGRFDMRTFPFPKPKEGGGVSNNHTRMGPPRFAKARFALADSLRELRVIMRY